MCGIAGLIWKGGASSDIGSEMTQMLQALKHRGPDSTGFALYGKPQKGVEILRFKVAEQEEMNTGFDIHRQVIERKAAVDSRLEEMGAKITEKEDATEYAFRYHFEFDGGQPGGGGTGRLFVNDEQVGEGRIEKTVPSVFSADETMDIGIDTATPVTSDYPEAEANAFQGEIDWVRIDIEDDDVSHLIPEEVLYHSAIGRQ